MSPHRVKADLSNTLSAGTLEHYSEVGYLCAATVGVAWQDDCDHNPLWLLIDNP